MYINNNILKKILLIIFFSYNTIPNIKYCLLKFYLKKQSKRFEKYLNFLNANIKRVKRFNKRKNPKISVISPIFNRERYIPRFIRSIQCQYFNDIEITLFKVVIITIKNKFFLEL